MIAIAYDMCIFQCWGHEQHHLVPLHRTDIAIKLMGYFGRNPNCNQCIPRILDNLTSKAIHKFNYFRKIVLNKFFEILDVEPLWQFHDSRNVYKEQCTTMSLNKACWLIHGHSATEGALLEIQWQITDNALKWANQLLYTDMGHNGIDGAVQWTMALQHVNKLGSTQHYMTGIIKGVKSHAMLSGWNFRDVVS